MGYRKAARMRRTQWVGGHYRTSSTGKTYWVNGHVRNDYSRQRGHLSDRDVRLANQLGLLFVGTLIVGLLVVVTHS